MPSISGSPTRIVCYGVKPTPPPTQSPTYRPTISNSPSVSVRVKGVKNIYHLRHFRKWLFSWCLPLFRQASPYPTYYGAKAGKGWYSGKGGKGSYSSKGDKYGSSSKGSKGYSGKSNKGCPTVKAIIVCCLDISPYFVVQPFWLMFSQQSSSKSSKSYSESPSISSKSSKSYTESPSTRTKSSKGYVLSDISFSTSLHYHDDEHLFTRYLNDASYSSKSSKGSSGKSSKGSSGCIDDSMPSNAPSVSFSPSTSSSPTTVVCFAARPSNPPSSEMPTYFPTYFPTSISGKSNKSAKVTKSSKGNSTKSQKPVALTKQPTSKPTTHFPVASKATKSSKMQKKAVTTVNYEGSELRY